MSCTIANFCNYQQSKTSRKLPIALYGTTGTPMYALAGKATNEWIKSSGQFFMEVQLLCQPLERAMIV